jgi:hypothetical protein
LDTREVTHMYRLNKWTEIIRECRSSGQTVSSWCADHNINPKSYYYWLKRVRTAACEALPSIGAGDSPIVPISIPVVTGISHKGQESSPDILLRFGNITVELRNNASSILIENTLRALQNVR